MNPPHFSQFTYKTKRNYILIRDAAELEFLLANYSADNFWSYCDAFFFLEIWNYST